MVMKCVIYPVLVTLSVLVQVQISFQPRSEKVCWGRKVFSLAIIRSIAFTNRLSFLKTLT